MNEPKRPTLKREDYKAIKHMNREDLTKYLYRIYRRGFDADTHCLDFVDTAHGLDDRLESLLGSLYIVIYIIITTCLDSSSSFYFATCIYDAENRVSTTEV